MGKKYFRIVHDRLCIFLIIMMYIISLLSYVYLPDKIPSHWNIEGAVDGYMAKSFYLLFFPSLILGIYILMSYISCLDPKSESYQEFKSVFEGFRFLLIFLLCVIYTATLIVAFGKPMPVSKIVQFLLGIMFMFVGKNFSKIKHNFTFGIKTPWTLANEKVWDKTHQVSGPLWIGAGIIWIISIFLKNKVAFFINMIALIGVLTYGVIYSYVVYKRLQE